MKARQVAVFRRTTLPRRAFPLTMQYGTPILRQSAGRNSTIYKDIFKFTYIVKNRLKLSIINQQGIVRVEQLLNRLHALFTQKKLISEVNVRSDLHISELQCMQSHSK